MGSETDVYKGMYISRIQLIVMPLNRRSDLGLPIDWDSMMWICIRINVKK